MFKYITAINKKIKQFSIIFGRIVYDSFENDSDIHNQIDDKLGCYLLNNISYENDPFLDIFSVETSKKDSRFILNLSLLENSNIGFSPKVKKDGKLIIITNDEDGKSVLGLFDFASENIVWKTNYFSGTAYLGESILYVAKINEDFSNYIYAYNQGNGGIKWNFSFGSGVRFQNLEFITEFNKVIYVYNKENRKIYAIDMISGNLLKNWQFKGRPIFYNNTISSFTSIHEILDLQNLVYNSVNINSYLKKATGYDYLWESIDFIAEGFGFISRRNTVNEKDYVYVLYAFDLTNYKLVWSHEFEHRYMKNFRDIKYVNGKLYFLRGDGTLHIFEKQTQT